ncbi:MAG: hypothetical protein JSV15_06555 [Candidatus Bathyarchaeota archaeon]|nr:MAG: hypothetical protein JSV15_06555 [Candidatus Bathyarchaeota archaeon]
MKKTVLYVSTAVLLGVAMMITPLWLSWTSQATLALEEKPEDFVELLCESALSFRRWEDIQGDFHQVNQETTASYEGVEIFAVGFILALAARFIVKRRAPYPQFPIRPG